MARNGAISLTEGPSSTLDGAEGSAQGRAGVRDAPRRDGFLDPALPIARQVVPPTIYDNNRYMLEKFQKKRG